MLHLHEPLVPGADDDGVPLPKPAPARRHVPRRRRAAPSYRYLNPVVRWLASRLDLRCAVSDDARALAEDHLGGDLRADCSTASRSTASPSAEPWPNRRRPTIFFLGRHEPRKGLDVLLAALPLAARRTCRLWSAATAPRPRALRQRHAGDPRIEWLGRMSDEEKRRRLRAADVFCAPSLRGESFGVVLLEAMAAGAVVVASDLPGYRRGRPSRRRRPARPARVTRRRSPPPSIARSPTMTCGPGCWCRAASEPTAS